MHISYVRKLMASLQRRIGYRRNLALAKQLWPDQISREQQHLLKTLSENYRLSVAAGDLQLLENRWYVTHSGLIGLAQRRGCSGIDVNILEEFCDLTSSRWVFKAIVYKRNRTKGFVGYGDADPSNISTLVHGAEMRIAETRAVNRALRKAYGIGLCSVEELGAFSNSAKPTSASSHSYSNGSHSANGTGNGQPRLRDQLCLLIRQYNLNANLVKAYAADFCGTEALNGASRELVKSFISHLSAAAKENRDALVCKLNSYSQPVEARS
jgi:hypothetical protein